MKRYYIKKQCAMIMFLIFIFFFSVMNFYYAYPALITLETKGTKDHIQQFESTINDQVYMKYAFIESYGFLHKLLDKHEINAFEVVKDQNGSLYLETFENGPRDCEEIIQQTITLETYLKSKGTVFMSILMPDKYMPQMSVFDEGYPYDYVNEQLDNYKTGLQEHNIEYFDIRPALMNSSLSHEELFYKTDHHWRIETAFLAYQHFLDKFQTVYGIDLDSTKYYSDANHYNFITYPSMFLGSLGRKSGSSYAGSDDFTFVYPKFDTNFQMTWSLQDSTFTKTGRFEVTLANPSYLHHTGLFDAKSDTYSMYLDGNAAFTSISNLQDCEPIKVLFIKDSYALPFVAFFANHVKQVDLIDPRYYEGDLTDFIVHSDYDYVFSTLSGSSLRSEYFPKFDTEK